MTNILVRAKTPGKSNFFSLLLLLNSLPGIRITERADNGRAMMGTIHKTQRHDANCTKIPPRTKPRERPKVPAPAKLRSTIQDGTTVKIECTYKVSAIPCPRGVV